MQYSSSPIFRGNLRRTLQQGFHRQLDAALFVGFHDLDLDDLAFPQVVGDFFDTLVGNLADVQQAVLARQQVDQRAKIKDLDHWAFVDLADFRSEERRVGK